MMSFGPTAFLGSQVNRSWMVAAAMTATLACDPMVHLASAQDQTPASTSSQGFDLQAWAEGDHLTGDWFGHRTTLTELGIDFQATLQIDWTKNLQGGESTDGSIFRHLFQAELTFDSKLAGYEGGSFCLLFEDQNGREAAEKVGDIQGTDNNDADGRTQLSQIWYRQELLEGKLWLKVGKIDANDDFAAVAYADGFINGSAATFATTSTGGGGLFPTYPDPSFGVELFVEPVDWWYAGFGAFDGSASRGVRTGTAGPVTLWQSPSSQFLIGETGLRWALGESELAGRVAVGGWGHTRKLERFDGQMQDGTAGFFVLLEQKLWQPLPSSPPSSTSSEAAADHSSDDRGLGVFFQYDLGDRNLSEVEHHYAAGFAWTGLLPGRDADVWGVGLSWATLTDDDTKAFIHTGEINLEMFYAIQVTPFLSVKPDIQHVIHPGGNDLPNAWVGTLRVEVAF